MPLRRGEGEGRLGRVLGMPRGYVPHRVGRVGHTDVCPGPGGEAVRFRLEWARNGMPTRALWVRLVALAVLVIVGLVT